MLDWDKELLEIAGVSEENLSTVVEPTEFIGDIRDKYQNKYKVKIISGIVGGSDGPLSHLGSLGSTDNKISLTVGTGSAIRLLKHNPTVIPGKEAWCYYLNVYFFIFYLQAVQPSPFYLWF